MNLVAFVGFQGSGKNTAALALVDHGYTLLSFADALKDALAAIFCWDRDLLEGITPESRIWREQVDPWWADKLGIPDFTPRWAMRNFGTEVMRRHLHSEIWVLNVERRISMIDGPVALTDARFPNEINLARQRGGRIFRIRRQDDPWWMYIAEMTNSGSVLGQHVIEAMGVHPSEYAWIGHPIDAIIENDADVPTLHHRVLSTILL